MLAADEEPLLQSELEGLCLRWRTGVRVCERWRSSFQSFYDDMGARPPGHFLQRIRTTEEFGPGNCRWGLRRPGGRPKKGELDIGAAATEEVRDGTLELRTTFMQQRD